MNSFNQNIIKSIGSNSIESLSDFAEITLDQLQEEGVLKEIPIIGTLLSLGKIGANIRDLIFINKLLKFLQKSSEINQEQRSNFISSFSSSKKLKFLGEKLFNTIDSIDSEEKSILLGKAFNQLVEGKIEINFFYDIAYVIENIKYHYIEDLVNLAYDIEEEKLPNDIMDHFRTIGIISQDSTSKTIFSHSSNRPKKNIQNLTTTGEYFITNIIDFDRELLKNEFKSKIYKMPVSRKMASFKEWNRVERIPKKEIDKWINNLTFKEFFSIKLSKNFFTYNTGTQIELYELAAAYEYYKYHPKK